MPPSTYARRIGHQAGLLEYKTGPLQLPLPPVENLEDMMVAAAGKHSLVCYDGQVWMLHDA